VHQGCCSSGSLHEPEHHDRASAGAVQLGSVGVALSVFGSATKLMNVPLLSVTTQIVATAVGSNEGVPGLCPSTAQAHPRTIVTILLGRHETVLPVAKKGLKEACARHACHKRVVISVTACGLVLGRAESSRADACWLLTQAAPRRGNGRSLAWHRRRRSSLLPWSAPARRAARRLPCRPCELQLAERIHAPAPPALTQTACCETSKFCVSERTPAQHR